MSGVMKICSHFVGLYRTKCSRLLFSREASLMLSTLVRAYDGAFTTTSLAVGMARVGHKRCTVMLYVSKVGRKME
jgi:hypothetical protein